MVEGRKGWYGTGRGARVCSVLFQVDILPARKRSLLRSPPAITIFNFSHSFVALFSLFRESVAVAVAAAAAAEPTNKVSLYNFSKLAPFSPAASRRHAAGLQFVHFLQVL